MSLTIREEQFLAKIAGEDVVTPEPLTRKEYFLAKIAGDDVEIPEPLTREEELLGKIASGGGGGGANQYLVEIGTTTPRMVYEAIQQGKSIAILMTTSYEVTDTFPPTVDAFYNNISDATPLTLECYADIETGTMRYLLFSLNGGRVAETDSPDGVFSAS